MWRVRLMTFSKYYIYLIFIIFSSLLSYCFYGFNHNMSFKRVRIVSEPFSKHHFIYRLFMYFLIIFWGIVFHIYEEKSSKPEKKEEENLKE